MTKKIKILIPQACRSDWFANSFIKQLGDHFDVYNVNVVPAKFGASYEMITHCFHPYKPDLVLIIGDRIEMAGSAAAAFHNGIKIAHLGAGITNYPHTTLDDINRHNITNYADIAFCEGREGAMVVAELWLAIRKLGSNDFNSNLREFWEYNIHMVGAVHLDDLKLNLGLVPNDPYDLVLINPETLKDSGVNLLKQADLITKEFRRKSIWLPSNPDQFNKLVGKINFDYIISPFRHQFLGLLSQCERFITNSSAAYYEAPYVMKDPSRIIMVGDRNRNRNTPKNLKRGASNRIIKILEEYFNEQN